MMTAEEDERKRKTYFYNSLQVLYSFFGQSESMFPQDEKVESYEHCSS